MKAKAKPTLSARHATGTHDYDRHRSWVAGRD